MLPGAGEVKPVNLLCFYVKTLQSWGKKGSGQTYVKDTSTALSLQCLGTTSHLGRSDKKKSQSMKGMALPAQMVPGGFFFF